MAENKLKPCPFCGGKAKLFTVGCFHVYCDACMSSGARYSTISRAIEAWNSRVDEKRLAANCVGENDGKQDERHKSD